MKTLIIAIMLIALTISCGPRYPKDFKNCQVTLDVYFKNGSKETFTIKAQNDLIGIAMTNNWGANQSYIYYSNKHEAFGSRILAYDVTHFKILNEKCDE